METSFELETVLMYDKSKEINYCMQINHTFGIIQQAFLVFIVYRVILVTIKVRN